MDNTQWIVVGIGGVAFLMGIIFIIMGVLSRRKLNVIKETPTVTALQACEMADPAGMARVEIKGSADSPTPLTAPATGTSCLYYRHKVERMERRQVTDSNGHTRTEESWHTVADNKASTPFVLKDATGEVRVDPDGAEFVAQMVLNDQPGSYGYDTSRFDAGGGGVLGGVLDTVIDVATGGYGDYYRTSEWVIPLGQPVYVLGSACRGTAGAEVREGEGPFIVSYRSEEGLTKKYTWHYVLWLAFGVLFSAGGIAAVVYGYGFMNK